MMETMICHWSIADPNTVNRTFAKTTVDAIFGAEAKKATTGVGAPSYTSGVQTCMGAAEILKARPTIISTMPNSAPVVMPASAMPANDVVPVKP